MFELLGSGALSKLGKDEVYTFIFGFSLGLLYYLSFFIEIVDGKISFLISSDFHAALVLLAMCLLSTLVLYLIYIVFSLYVIKKTRPLISDPESGESKIDITIARPDIKILYENITSILSSGVHFFSLICCSLLLILPFLWIMMSRYLMNHNNVGQNMFLFMRIVIVTICIIYMIYRRFVLKRSIDYYKYVHLVNKGMIQITYNPEEYAKSINRIVDSKYKPQKTNGNV